MTKGKISWPLSNNEDKDIIRLMIKEKTLTVTASDYKGVITNDVYSLVGFGEAIRYMRSLCK